MRTRHTAAGATVTAIGEIDIVTAPALWVSLDETRRELRTISPGSTLLVDLRQVAFLSAAGLGTLLAFHSRCGADGTGMRIIADHPAVLRPLEVTGLRWLLAAPLTTDEGPRPCT
jgi:anti-anti-sigma factor